MRAGGPHRAGPATPQPAPREDRQAPRPSEAPLVSGLVAIGAVTLATTVLAVLGALIALVTSWLF